MPAVALLAAWAASGCAVPFGPGYTIEKQTIEVGYAAAAPDDVNIRASYQLRNTGTVPLEAMNLALPAADTFALQAALIEWQGKALDAALAADSDGHLHVPLPEKWSRGGRGELVITYGLKIEPDKAGLGPDHAVAFYLPSSGWYPSLLPPIGTFSSGGTPPAKWDLVVSVPEGYRVHASGSERGHDRSSGGTAARPGLVFEQKPRADFDPFVAAGPYVQQEVHSSSGSIFLWSAQPISAARAKEIGASLAFATSYFDSEFGAGEKAKEPAWIIQCPPGEPPSPAEPWLSVAGCLPQPYSAVVEADFFGATTPQAALESVDLQLAATWLHFSAHLGRTDPEFPLAAVGDYAAFALSTSQESASRDGIVRDLLQRVAAAPFPEKPLMNVNRKDLPEVLDRARLQSELFFVALEDRCGAKNVHRALARANRLLRGQTWSLPDLRSAMEAECGGPASDSFFRQWIYGAGIPEDFRARYSAAPAPKPSQAGSELEDNVGH